MEILITVEEDVSGEKYNLSGISQPFTAKAAISASTKEAVVEELRTFFPNDTVTCLPNRIFN